MLRLRPEPARASWLRLAAAPSFSGPLLGGFIEVHPFAWNVKIKADGSVKGHYQYTQVRDGVELIVRGSLTCATIQGNHVWVGGVIDDSSRESLIGLEMWFQAAEAGVHPGHLARARLCGPKSFHARVQPPHRSNAGALPRAAAPLTRPA